MSETQNQADTAQRILEQVDANGHRTYDHAVKDPLSGQWRARRHDDHTACETVDPTRG